MIAQIIADERAVSIVEYAIILAFIAGFCVIAVSALGGGTQREFSSLTTQL